jgi:hypothetical protein
LDASPTTLFRKCPKCGWSWTHREALLEDPAAVLAGYQAHFERPELGLLLFHHLTCRTTFGIRAGDFADLYHGPFFTESRLDGDGCGQFCSRQDELGQCTEECKHAWVREVLHIVDHYRC